MSKNSHQVELARETLSVFAEHGEDFSDTRHVIHFFYGGNFAGLEQELIKQGYATRLTVNQDGIVAESHEVIGEEWRTTTLADLCRLADRFDVECDGWEASMTRQPKQAAPQSSYKPSLFAKLFGKKK